MSYTHSEDVGQAGPPQNLAALPGFAQNGSMRCERTAFSRLKCGLLGVTLAWTTPSWSHSRQTLEHVVTAGDSLWALARHYQVSVEALQSANGLGDATRIRTGQKLRIPRSAPKTGTQRGATKQPAPSTKQPAPQSVNSVQNITPSANEAPIRRDSARASIKVTPTARERAERLFFTAESLQQVSTLEEVAPPWVLQPPAVENQGRSVVTADGSHPCSTTDPGFGNYQRWQQVAPMAHVLLPKQLRLAEDGGFNALFHFHGREPARKEWVQVMNRAVLVAVDVGIDSESYRAAFSDPRTFGRVVQAVEQAVALQTNRADARAHRLVVSSWSAGFGAVEQILGQPYGRQHVLGVVLLDGLHAGYDASSLDRVRLAPFVQFARAAAMEHRLMYISHSSVPAVGYASTTETANYLIYKLDARPDSVDQRGIDPLQLHRISSFSSGNFHARGFKGGTAADHCGHMALLRDVLRVHVNPLWSDPGQVLAQARAPGPAPLEVPGPNDARADLAFKPTFDTRMRCEAQPQVAAGAREH